VCAEGAERAQLVRRRGHRGATLAHPGPADGNCVAAWQGAGLVHDWCGQRNEFTLALDGFHESFCADLPADDAAFSAITQRPLAGVALTEAAPTPAWRSRPVWAVLPTANRCIDPGVHHFSYDRMGATVTEIDGASHVVMISHPKEVAEVVMTAVAACAM
jgi:pimeloyl-ACP methyl ester carboxylesterase